MTKGRTLVVAVVLSLAGTSVSLAQLPVCRVRSLVDVYQPTGIFGILEVTGRLPKNTCVSITGTPPLVRIESISFLRYVSSRIRGRRVRVLKRTRWAVVYRPTYVSSESLSCSPPLPELPCRAGR
jgi:hypothetical protein